MGSGAIVRDIEEIAFGQKCQVEEYGCLGKCGKGPNLQLVTSTGSQIHTCVKNLKKALAICEDADVMISDLERKVAKIKFEARREDDAEKRDGLINKAFSVLGGEAAACKREPFLAASILLLRVKDRIKEQVADALKDAEMAVRLAPRWPQAHIALANCLESSRRSGEGAKALNEALEMGTGINKATLKRQLARLERKAKEEEANPPPVAEPAKQESNGEKPKAKGKAKGKAKAKPKSQEGPADGEVAAQALGDAEVKPEAKPKPKTSGRKEKKEQGEAKGDAKAALKKAKAAEVVTVGEVEEEEIPDFLEWSVERVIRLNHDCLNLVLTCSNQILQRQPDVGDLWHVDFLKEGSIGELPLKRAYTPVSNFEAYKCGTLDIMIKVYPNGQMTRYLASLRPGSQLLVSQPAYTLKLNEDLLGLVIIAGGSAVTVALQICEVQLKRLKPSVLVHLFLCNRTIEDVLYRPQFDELLAQYSNFRMVHCLSRGQVPAFDEGKAEWRTGRIAQDVIAETDPRTLAIVSGPMGLCQAALDLWAKLGRSEETMRVMDELPPVPDGEDDGEQPAAEPVDPSLQMRQAPGTPLKEAMVTEPKVLRAYDKGLNGAVAPFGGMPFLCSIMRPFWCQGREVDHDDAEGVIPTISVSHE